MTERFDTNENGNHGFCNECISDDRREDHRFECDCYCHFPAKIIWLEAENAKLKERERGLEEKLRAVGALLLDVVRLIHERKPIPLDFLEAHAKEALEHGEPK